MVSHVLFSLADKMRYMYVVSSFGCSYSIFAHCWCFCSTPWPLYALRLDLFHHSIGGPFSGPHVSYPSPKVPPGAQGTGGGVERRENRRIWNKKVQNKKIDKKKKTYGEIKVEKEEKM